MTISDKTRKLLWGRSGNRCVFCRCELVLDGEKVIIGDECHIIAKHLGGPRADESILEGDLDSYQNLILLCKIHHKLIDDQPIKYTVDVLKKMKAEHEEWIQLTLQSSTSNNQGQGKPKNELFAVRVTEGKQVINILSNAYAFDFDSDELENEEEVNLVGAFLQDAQDWGDILSEIGASERVKAAFNTSQSLKELENHGFYVFGAVHRRTLKILGRNEAWPVAVLRVIRKTSQSINQIDMP